MNKHIKPVELWQRVVDPKLVYPSDGWANRSLYLVRISHNPYNPVYEAFFWTGFVQNGVPGGYNRVFHYAHDRIYEFHELHYIYPMKLLHTETIL